MPCVEVTEMIELPELINYWSGKLLEHPPITTLDWHDVCHSTLAYLNAYRTTTLMLRDLAKDINDLEKGAKNEH